MPNSPFADLSQHKRVLIMFRVFIFQAEILLVLSIQVHPLVTAILNKVAVTGITQP